MNLRDSLERGAALFNTGKFWEAHEAWEEAWLELENEEKLFLQGLIQVAVRAAGAKSEFRFDGTRFLSGWCGHRFAQRDDQRWDIQVRQVNLIDCDQNLRNPSIVL